MPIQVKGRAALGWSPIYGRIEDGSSHDIEPEQFTEELFAVPNSVNLPAAVAIKLMDRITKVESLEILTSGETRATVLSAAETRRAGLGAAQGE